MPTSRQSGVIARDSFWQDRVGRVFRLRSRRRSSGRQHGELRGCAEDPDACAPLHDHACRAVVDLVMSTSPAHGGLGARARLKERTNGRLRPHADRAATAWSVRKRRGGLNSRSIGSRTLVHTGMAAGGKTRNCSGGAAPTRE